MFVRAFDFSVFRIVDISILANQYTVYTCTCTSICANELTEKEGDTALVKGGRIMVVRFGVPSRGLSDRLSPPMKKSSMVTGPLDKAKNSWNGK